MKKQEIAMRKYVRRMAHNEADRQGITRLNAHELDKKTRRRQDSKFQHCWKDLFSEALGRYLMPATLYSSKYGKYGRNVAVKSR